MPSVLSVPGTEDLGLAGSVFAHEVARGVLPVALSQGQSTLLKGRALGPGLWHALGSLEDHCGPGREFRGCSFYHLLQTSP